MATVYVTSAVSLYPPYFLPTLESARTSTKERREKEEYPLDPQPANRQNSLLSGQSERGWAARSGISLRSELIPEHSVTLKHPHKTLHSHLPYSHIPVPQNFYHTIYPSLRQSTHSSHTSQFTLHILHSFHVIHVIFISPCSHL